MLLSSYLLIIEEIWLFLHKAEIWVLEREIIVFYLLIFRTLEVSEKKVVPY